MFSCICFLLLTGQSSDYDPDGFTPSQKSLVQPSHQARQKALHARREKTQRHKRALDGTEAPKFNISRPGQLFHDEEAYALTLIARQG